MSDTLSTTPVQRLCQQRQILAMMGIEQWVQPESPTLSITEMAEMPQADAAPTIESPVSPIIKAEASTDSRVPASSTEINNEDASYVAQEYFAPDTLSEQSLSEPELPEGYLSKNDLSKNSSPRTSMDDTSKAAQMVAPLVEKTTVPVEPSLQVNKSATIDETSNKSNDKIAPFDLQGSRFGDWVLMVDIAALNFDSQKLWHSITKALSITYEDVSFPICAGMDSCEIINASLAGFVFKLGRSETVSVAALTPLPNGVTHPNIMSVPTLDAMLKDSALKRELWRKIAHHSQP